MRILHVAYPFEPASPASAGGTEQVLWLLDRELTRLGHESVVVARQGSRVHGRLVEGAPARGDFETACHAHYAAVHALLSRERFDLIHNQGSDLHLQLEEVPAPLLTTLHLARPLYAYPPFVERSGWYYNLVSESQRRQYGELPLAAQLPVVPNGIPVDLFAPSSKPEGFALVIGRVCAEKGFHFAVSAARQAGVPLIIAGKVYDFESHRLYFRQHIEPFLGDQVRFVEAPPLEVKRRLLSAARCVLIPSDIEETSSLVAMEAAASGTPAIAFRRGALPEIVQHGVSGLVVDDTRAMAEAIGCIGEIDRADCRRVAEDRFSGSRMAERYLHLYRRILRRPAQAVA